MMKNILKSTKSVVFIALLILSSCASHKSQVACPSFDSNKVAKSKPYKKGINLSGVREVFSFQKRPKSNNSRSKNHLREEKQGTDFEMIFTNPSASAKDEPSMELASQPIYYKSAAEKTQTNEIEVKRDVQVQKTKNKKGNVENSNVINPKIKKVGKSSIKEIYQEEKPKNERKAAIIKGAAILLMAILAGISIPVLGTTTASIGLVAILLLDILISFSINSYYKKRKPKLAKITSLLRLLYSAIFGVGIGYHIAGSVSMFNTFWQIGLIGFGFHLITLGILFDNEGGKKWVNTAIKSLLIIAGIGYMFLNIGVLFVPNPIAFAAIVESIFILPMILGEVSFAIWMLFKGGKN